MRNRLHKYGDEGSNSNGFVLKEGGGVYEDDIHQIVVFGEGLFEPTVEASEVRLVDVLLGNEEMAEGL